MDDSSRRDKKLKRRAVIASLILGAQQAFGQRFSTTRTIPSVASNQLVVFFEQSPEHVIDCDSKGDCHDVHLSEHEQEISMVVCFGARRVKLTASEIMDALEGN